MADTGAPWNLPYPLATDLVRDGAQAIQDLAEAVADGLAVGIGSNSVTQVMTSTFVTTSTSFVNVTGLAATITPSTATSRVLVLVNINAVEQAANAEVSVRVTATAGATDLDFASVFSTSDTLHPTSGMVLHSPATASAVTYQVQIVRVSGSGNAVAYAPARITLIEVAS